MDTTKADRFSGYMFDGRYEVRGVLGIGGMAEVRDAWDMRLNRPVAIKLMHSALSAQTALCERFRAEARAAAGLSHANIVAVHDCGEEDGTPFIVMERLPGPTLADEIARGPLSGRRVRCVLENVLAALATAQANGVLHRDVKPGNILAARCGDEVKVADFGIAKTPAAAHTVAGQIVGTLAYLSPERVAGAPASVADDIYVVGVVGYEALAGHRPFRNDDNIAALAHAILSDRPAPLKTERPDVDPELIAVIEKAKGRDRRWRFSSAEEMRAALTGRRPELRMVSAASRTRPATRVLPGPPIHLEPGTFVPPGTYIAPTKRRRSRPTRRAKRVAGAAAVLAVLVVMAVALLLNTSSSGPAPVGTGTSVSPPPIPPPVPQPSLVQQPVTQVDRSTIKGSTGKPGNNGGNGKKNFKPGRGH